MIILATNYLKQGQKLFIRTKRMFHNVSILEGLDIGAENAMIFKIINLNLSTTLLIYGF